MFFIKGIVGYEICQRERNKAMGERERRNENTLAVCVGAQHEG